MEYFGNLSIIFHWGLYSVPGYMREMKTSKEGNSSEWYMERLTEDPNGYRPLEKNSETKIFHANHYQNIDYFDFSQYFTLDEWDPDRWCIFCRNLGATTVILTARHHDGYCLYPSNFCLHPKQRSSRNILQEFKEAAIRQGLQFGFYYSWFEYHVGMTKEYVNNVIVPQMNELLAYEPNNFWFDGNWQITTNYAQDTILQICTTLREKGIIINDRIYSKTKKVLEHIGLPDNGLSENSLGLASYRVYEDRKIPDHNPGVPFSSIQTIGNSWGANKYTNKYKTGEQLANIYNSTVSNGGNLCLNFGPNEQGLLDTNEMNSAIEMWRIVSGLH